MIVRRPIESYSTIIPTLMSINFDVDILSCLTVRSRTDTSDQLPLARIVIVYKLMMFILYCNLL